MLVSDQTDINFRPKTYQLRTTEYQKRTKKMLVSDHGISESGQKNTVFRSAKYQKRTKSMLFLDHGISEMGQINVGFGSVIYQFRVRNISISGQRDGRQYPTERVKPLNFRVQIYNTKTPLSSLFGKIILHEISNH